MKFLNRWFKKEKEVMAEPEFTSNRTGYGTLHGESYCNLLAYVMYLNTNEGTDAAQPTGPDYYKWWECELFKIVEGPVIHVGKATSALEYIFRINFENHGLVIPSDIKEKAYARIKLGTG